MSQCSPSRIRFLAQQMVLRYGSVAAAARAMGMSGPTIFRALRRPETTRTPTILALHEFFENPKRQKCEQLRRCSVRTAEQPAAFPQVAEAANVISLAIYRLRRD